MQGRLPPEAEETVVELRDLQEKRLQVAFGKERADAELADAEAALEAVGDAADDATMYRAVGEVYAETGHDEAEEELQDRVEGLEIRARVIDKQEDRIEEQFEALQSELERTLRTDCSGGPSHSGHTPDGAA